VHNKH